MIHVSTGVLRVKVILNQVRDVAQEFQRGKERGEFTLCSSNDLKIATAVSWKRQLAMTSCRTPLG